MPGPSAEDDLIAQYFAGWAGEGAFGLRDDAARLDAPPGHDLVVTTDAIVAGVHFFPDDPPDAIAVKALGVNLSDLVAKGASPLAFLLSLVLPKGFGGAWLEAFAASLASASRTAGCRLLGGDTTSTPGPLTISITAFGLAPHGRMVTRLGARSGDLIAVAGTIGDAALGLVAQTAPDRLASLAETDRSWLIERYRRPDPPLALAAAIARHAHAAMDVSDGLVGDLAKMLRASGCGGRLDLARVPLSRSVGAAIAIDPRLLLVALTGGDDYQPLVTAAPDQMPLLTAAACEAGFTLTTIGRVTAEPNLVCVDADGRQVAFESASFSHF